MPQRNTRDPRSKEELLNKMLSFDFHGIPDLGDVQINRTSPQTVELTFPKLGRTYELTVRIPRDEADGGEEIVWASEPKEAPPQRRSKKQ